MDNKYFKIMTGILGFSLLLLLLNSCMTKNNTASAEREIMDILRQERKAHVEKNADLFFSEFDKDFILINTGEVSNYDSADFRHRFDQYLQSSDFIKWDDVSNPIIKFSDDQSMAYAIVQKLVILKNKKEGNHIDTVNFAWVSIYQKKGKDWKQVCNISTNK
jgi:hypothetical protein